MMRTRRSLPPPLPLARWRGSILPSLFRIPPPFRRFNADEETGWAHGGIPLGDKVLVWAEPWKDCTIAVLKDDWGYQATWIDDDGRVLGWVRVPRRVADGHDPRVRAWCIATADWAVRTLREVAPESAPVSPEAESWLRRRLADLGSKPEAPA